MELETKTVFYNNQKWEYVVTYKQQKHMYLRLSDQKIFISAPFFVKPETIEHFVLSNLPKISKKIQHQSLIAHKISFAHEPFIYLFDQKLRIIVKYQTPTKLFLTNEALVIYTKYNYDNAAERKILVTKINNFLKALAQPVFFERLKYWEKMMHLQVRDFNLRLMTSKWGVCFYQKQTITFNYKLVHFSYQVIDYVIIHELAHLMYPNHGNDFWNLVRLYCHNYQECRKILKYSNIGVN